MHDDIIMQYDFTGSPEGTLRYNTAKDSHHRTGTVQVTDVEVLASMHTMASVTTDPVDAARLRLAIDVLAEIAAHKDIVLAKKLMERTDV